MSTKIARIPERFGMCPFPRVVVIRVRELFEPRLGFMSHPHMPAKKSFGQTRVIALAEQGVRAIPGHTLEVPRTGGGKKEIDHQHRDDRESGRDAPNKHESEAYTSMHARRRGQLRDRRADRERMSNSIDEAIAAIAGEYKKRFTGCRLARDHCLENSRRGVAAAFRPPAG